MRKLGTSLDNQAHLRSPFDEVTDDGLFVAEVLEVSARALQMAEAIAGKAFRVEN